MAKQVSSVKESITAKVPIKNAKMLRDEAANYSGGMAAIMNEALCDWLKLHGYDPEVNTDGRAGKWKFIVNSRIRITEDGRDERSEQE